MVPIWGRCLGRLWNLEEMELCWEKFVTGGGLWPPVLQDRPTPHFFLFFILYSYVYGGGQVPECGDLKRTEDPSGPGVTSGRELLDEDVRTELRSVL